MTKKVNLKSDYRTVQKMVDTALRTPAKLSPEGRKKLLKAMREASRTASRGIKINVDNAEIREMEALLRQFQPAEVPEELIERIDKAMQNAADIEGEMMKLEKQLGRKVSREAAADIIEMEKISGKKLPLKEKKAIVEVMDVLRQYRPAEVPEGLIDRIGKEMQNAAETEREMMNLEKQLGRKVSREAASDIIETERILGKKLPLKEKKAIVEVTDALRQYKPADVPEELIERIDKAMQDVAEVERKAMGKSKAARISGIKKALKNVKHPAALALVAAMGAGTVMMANAQDTKIAEDSMAGSVLKAVDGSSLSEEDKKNLVTGMTQILKNPADYGLTAEQAQLFCISVSEMKDNKEVKVLTDKLIKIGKEASLVQENTKEAEVGKAPAEKAYRRREMPKNGALSQNAQNITKPAAEKPVATRATGRSA